MHKLTSRQEEILQFIKDYLSEIGYPPTRSEIAQKMGFRSTNAAEEHLRALARKIGANDDLGICQVRHCIERRALDRHPPGHSQCSGEHEDDELVGNRPGDQHCHP